MTINPHKKDMLVIYDDRVELSIDQNADTIWASQTQIAELFGVDRTVATKHIKNILTSGELREKQVCAKFAHTAKDEKIYQVQHYNLDMILSVGYRVNSVRATQFRQWASARLKEYLIQGYSVNEKRLEELQKTIQLIGTKGNVENLTIEETRGFLDIITNYTESFVLLNRFDSDTLETSGDENISYKIEYSEAKQAIKTLKETLITKEETTPLFGNEKDTQFEGILTSVVQTFDGIYLYPTIESQASHLLYFIIKDHPFTDGNKRIGAFLFIWFLEKNRHCFRKNGMPKINESGLVSLALLIAASPPSEKEILIKLVINLINHS